MRTRDRKFYFDGDNLYSEIRNEEHGIAGSTGYGAFRGDLTKASVESLLRIAYIAGRNDMRADFRDLVTKSE